MTKFELKEKAVSNFQAVLNAAGMERGRISDGYSDKPMYWRGFVKDATPAIFLGFEVTDNMELNAADNMSMRRAVYINGTLYTRNGFGDAQYQALASRIEDECKKAGIIFNFNGESYDASTDSESAISYCNFEVEQRLIMD